MMLRRATAYAALLCAATHAAASEIVENRSFAGPKTTVSYAMWGGPSEVQNAREIGAAFVRKYPHIRLDISIYPWAQYWAKVQTQTASGIAPDVLSFYTGAFGVWVDRGALLPLDELAREAGFAFDDYHRVAIENCTWNDKLYAVPLEMPMWCIVYSKDKLEQAGIPREQWPRSDRPLSWQEFERLAKRLTLRKDDGTFAQYGMAAGQNWTNIMMSMRGGYPVDRQVNPTRPTIEGNIALRDAIVQLFRSEYADRWTLGAVPLLSGAFTASTDTLLLSPRFAMGTTGPFALKQLSDGGVRFGVMPVPRGPHPTQLINVNSVGIYSGSRHPKEAFLLLQFMASAEVQNLFGRRLKGIPALKSARDSLIDNEYGIKGVEAFLTDLQVAVPAITADNTHIKAALDKWMVEIEQDLDREYDRRLSALPRRNGAIAPEVYDGFVREMAQFVEQRVDRGWPDLAREMRAAFELSKRPQPSLFVRTVAPVLGVLALALLLGTYIWWIARTGERSPAAGMSRGNLTGYLFIAPWLVGLCCFLIGPILAAVYLSFTEWNMISAPRWIGAQNYAQMASDERFLIGLKNTLLYAALVIPISLVGGLTTAGLLTSRIRGSDLFKAIIYFPALFTGAEAAVLWVNMLNKEHGIINYVIGFFGIQPVNWMDQEHAFYSVVLMNAFWIGSAMIIYYAGMKQIPATLYEAAEIDGASAARRFMRITIPLLSPVILFMVVITTIGAFQVFTPALFFAPSSTAIGEPGDSLRFYSVNIYDTAFNNLRMGTACSYALVLFLLIFGITMLQMKLARRFVHTE